MLVDCLLLMKQVELPVNNPGFCCPWQHSPGTVVEVLDGTQVLAHLSFHLLEHFFFRISSSYVLAS